MRWRLVFSTAALAAFLGISQSGAALAACYPPHSQGQGEVDRTEVRPGECVTFSGGGFKPLTQVSITDDKRTVETVRSDADGQFTARVCFDTDAKVGEHQLRGTGLAAQSSGCDSSGERTVTAKVRVVGATSSGGSTSGGHANAGFASRGSPGGSAVLGDRLSRAPSRGVLPFTGAETALMALAAVGLIAAGVALNRRVRRGRRTAEG